MKLKLMIFAALALLFTLKATAGTKPVNCTWEWDYRVGLFVRQCKAVK